MTGSLLPPNARPSERALETAMRAGIDFDVVSDLWDPQSCPAALLPYLAWGLAITHWNPAWTEAEKREAIADALPFHFRKGTPASLREVIARFDPLIDLVEWFEDRDTMPPHAFRLELPLATETEAIYDQGFVAALLRDITVTKPLRSHMTAVYRMASSAAAFIAAAGAGLGLARMDGPADTAAPNDPVWLDYLQTEQGEPIRSGEGPFLETA